MIWQKSAANWVFWLVTLTSFVAVLVVVFALTPNETSMGAVQKIFYIHLPVAINTFLACLVTFVAGVCYIWRRTIRWDDLAVAAARTAVLLCSIVLLTGMVWGRPAWGAWWTWSPRLTFSLVLWLLYVVYLVVRQSIQSSRRRALVSAVYGIVAFVDVPLVYLSARMMDEIHPRKLDSFDSRMWPALIVSFVAVTLLTFGLIASQYRLGRRITALNRATSHVEEPVDNPEPTT